VGYGWCILSGTGSGTPSIHNTNGLSFLLPNLDQAPLSNSIQSDVARQGLDEGRCCGITGNTEGTLAGKSDRERGCYVDPRAGISLPV